MIYKKRIHISLFILIISSNLTFGQWPMSTDTAFNSAVANPTYEKGRGPNILLDGGHHNFFIQWDFIKPFSDLAKADGYQAIIDSQIFTPGYLNRFDIVVIFTALPFDFSTKIEVTDEFAFSKEEINNLYDWVKKGGSLLVFSEHAPFDQAINPLLTKFGITSSIGYTIDSLHYNKTTGRPGWIEFTIENKGLNIEHPILLGNSKKEKISKLLTFGGSALSGEGYSNILRLSNSSQNITHSTGVGPSGRGDTQGLAGKVGKGKLAAFGDSNGFTAMIFKNNDGSNQKAGMNLQGYDWKQFVLNSLHWLSGDLE